MAKTDNEVASKSTVSDFTWSQCEETARHGLELAISKLSSLPRKELKFNRTVELRRLIWALAVLDKVNGT